MGTRSTVGYRTPLGEIRATYVHYDGYPSNMIPSLEKMLQEEGYQKLLNWIENGLNAQGYRTVDDTLPSGSPGGGGVQEIDSQEYGYLITREGVLFVHSDSSPDAESLREAPFYENYKSIYSILAEKDNENA